MSRRLVATLSKAWRGVVWYMREISGEARYDHYLEHFAAEHPDERPLSEKEFLLAREAYDREHPNTSCCCWQGMMSVPVSRFGNGDASIWWTIACGYALNSVQRD